MFRTGRSRLVAATLIAAAFGIGSCSPRHDTTSVQEVTPITEAGYDSLLATSRGKVLLVNVWATWCAPCVEEFPDLVKAANAVDTSRVNFVGISIDRKRDVQSNVIPFLRKHNAPFKNFIGDFADDGAFIDRVHKEWSGAIPATFVYDAGGNLRSFHEGAAKYEDFMDAIANAQ